MPESKEWKEAQELLGCNECIFADLRKLFKGPCCRYPSKLITDSSGRCLKRRKPFKVPAKHADK